MFSSIQSNKPFNYPQLLSQVKQRVRLAQQRAAYKAYGEMLRMYYPELTYKIQIRNQRLHNYPDIIFPCQFYTCHGCKTFILLAMVMKKYFYIAINNTMKRIITYVFIAITTMYAYGGDYPPAHFRMGMYTLTRRQDIYISDINRWDAIWSKDTLVLYSNFHFLYKSQAHYGTTYYSYGEWNYQNEIFVLNSVDEQEDTLRLQAVWEKEHCKFGPTTRHFPAFRFQEMNETKLYNIDNYGVSFKKKKHQEVMMYDLKQKVDFDEFLYRFIHDSKYQSRVLQDAFKEDDFIFVKYPNTDKIDILCHSPLVIVNKKTVRHKYYSLKNSPFAFEKLPKAYYTILTDKERGFETECTFMIGDVPIYKMVFLKWDDKWTLGEIVVFNEGVDILGV